ncbi:MAG: hypothetical protein WA702_21155 [Bradyrhizobium sp.]|uniref:hypothetical protein n=1 Tax=Bradyrhizobium sp. TaxID=376 RepID=UPI003C7C6B26
MQSRRRARAGFQDLLADFVQARFRIWRYAPRFVSRDPSYLVRSMDRMLRRIGFVVLLSLALFLVLVAVNSNEPYLVKLRGGGHIALVLAAIGVRAAMICRGAWRGGIAKQVLLVTWCVPLVAFIAAQSVFAIRNTRRCTPRLRLRACSDAISWSATTILRKPPRWPARA